MLVAVCGLVQFPGGFASVAPAEVRSLCFRPGELIAVVGSVIAASGEAGGMVSPPSAAGVEILELLAGLGVAESESRSIPASRSSLIGPASRSTGTSSGRP